MNSATSLLSLAHVAERARTTRQTIYSWLADGVIDWPRYDVGGRPLWTPEETQRVVEIAQERLNKR